MAIPFLSGLEIATGTHNEITFTGTGGAKILAPVEMYLDASNDIYLMSHSSVNLTLGDNTASFAGLVTVGPGTTGSPYDSTTFLHVKGTTRSIVQQSSTADAYYMFGDAAANNVAWLGYNHSTNQLSLHTSGSTYIDGNTTFANNVTVEGGLVYLGTADQSSGHINSKELMTFNIDSDNDDTNRYFAFYKDGESANGTQLLKILETGYVAIGSHTPTLALDVKGGTNLASRFMFTKDLSTDKVLFGGADHDTFAAPFIGSSSNHTFTITQNGGAAITIDTSKHAVFEGVVKTKGYFQVNSSTALLRKYVSGWNSGAQSHDVIYNGWTANTGDYTYVKAAGNSTSGHGIIMAADLGTYLGTTDLETGAITDSATAPLDNTWAYFRNTAAYIKGDTTFGGSINVGSGPSRFTHQQNAGSRLELYNNRQDAGNVEVYRIAAYNSVEVAGVHFYRGSGGSSGYTKIFAKKNNASSLEQVVQFGTNNALTTTFAGDIIAPGLIDSADSNYYVDPAGTSVTNTMQANYFRASTTSTSDPILRLTDAGVADYDVVFPDTNTYRLETSTSSTKTFRLHNAGSGNFKMQADEFVKTGGTSSQYLMADGSVSTGGGTIDGSGAANRIAIWSDSDTLTSSASLFTNGSGQVKIGTFTDGSSNSGEYADDDLVIGDGSISIYPHRRGDYGLNATTATSTTFRSKLNIWSDNEDHITFGGASTHMVSAWEDWKMWINNDSGNNGHLKLYHTSSKTEFARLSGDGANSFVLGTFKATGDLRAPIFYDSDNTGYYLNPASRSNFGSLDLNSGAVWDATTQGTSKGSIHIDPNNATDHAGGSITWGASDTSSGTTAQAGIYVRSDGSYGTRMYLSTTDSYATGSKTTIRLEAAGGLYVDRGNFYAPLFYDSANTAYYVDPANTGLSINVAGEYKADVDHGNSGFIQTWRNTNTGTSAYVEHVIGQSGSSELRIGHAPNYSASDWNASWVYAVGKPLFLKSSSGNVVIYAGGAGASSEVAIFDTNQNTTFKGDVEIGTSTHNGELTIRSLDSSSSTRTAKLKFNIAGTDTTGFTLHNNTSGIATNTLIYDVSGTEKVTIYGDGHIRTVNNVTAQIFRDQDNTGYYVNPSGGSVLNEISIDDYIYHNGDTDTYLYFETDSIKLRTGGTDRLTLSNTEASFSENSRFGKEVTDNSGQAIKGYRLNKATSSSWTEGGTGAQTGWYGGNFGGSEITTKWVDGPHGERTLVAETTGDTNNDYDGGYVKAINNLDINKAHLSIVYIKRISSEGTGNVYHGTGAGTNQITDLSGNSNTNPYFHYPNLGSFPQDVWCVSIGVIQANNDDNTTAKTGSGDLQGIYRCDTGQKIMNSSSHWKMGSAGASLNNGIRFFHYYSTNANAKVQFAKPGFYEVNGDEPSLAEILTGGNRGLHTNGGDVTANRFYDWANTAFYVDPASTSVVNHMDMDTGNTSGKFAVMANAVHGSYDFYNNGTSYFNSAVTIDGNLTFTGNYTVDLGSGSVSIKKTAGGTNGNHAAIELYSSGTSDGGSAIAIQQQTSEGDTIIFADYEPHVEWGISTENSNNEIQFTAGNSTGTMGSKTLYNNAGTARTAYKKMIFVLGTGVMSVGGDVRAPIFYDLGNTAYYTNPAGLSQMHTIDFDGAVSGSNTGAAQIGRNHAYDTLELKGYGAELMIGAQHTEININYRTCNNNTSGHTPTTWKWRAGASNNWSDHYFGAVTSNGILTATTDVRAPSFADSNDTAYYLNPAGTGTSLKVAGKIEHKGIEPTAGTNIDQIYTTTKSLTVTTDWQDTGIDATDLATGTYIIQMYTDDHGTNSIGHYSEYYSGIMSWYSGNTNSDETDEIILHRAGHAPNHGDVFLRVERTFSADANDMHLQIKTSNNASGAANYVFKFRRMI